MPSKNTTPIPTPTPTATGTGMPVIPTPPVDGAAGKVWTALLDSLSWTDTPGRGATTREIADSARVATTTATKALAKLEADGLANREPGSGAGRSRIPDTWYAIPPADINPPGGSPARRRTGRHRPARQRPARQRPVRRHRARRA